MSLSTQDSFATFTDTMLFSERPEDNSEYFELPPSDLFVFWHPKAGLIVSPNVNYLPGSVPELQAPEDFRTNLTPKMLPDRCIYHAFRPRYVQNTGDLFARLNLNRAALYQQVAFVRATSLMSEEYILSTPVVERWARLEDALIDVGTTLIAALPSLPRFELPRVPWQYGYRDPHKSRDLTLKCALRSRDAFVDLSAFVSFAISLHMKGGMGLSSVFELVQQRSKCKPSRAWFDLLENSYVCKFEPNFRVGGYVDPYNSRWTQYIPKFTSVDVPIWIHWGHFHHVNHPLDTAAHLYSPPEQYVHLARQQTELAASLILPIIRYDPAPGPSTGEPILNHYPSFTTGPDSDYPMHSQEPMDFRERTASPQWVTPQWVPPSNSPVRDSPHSPSPRPETPLSEPSLNKEEVAARKATALAALEEYFRRQEDARETRLQKEQPSERQKREDQEQRAKTTMLYTKKSPVYEWRELPDGTYERVKLALSEIDDTWRNYTRNQRRYIGHINTWELCPQLPEFSDEFPRETEPYSDDEDDEDVYTEHLRVASDSQFAHPPGAGENPVYANELQALAQIQPVEEESAVLPIDEFNFARFMHRRFGYNIESPAGWTTDATPEINGKKLTLRHAMMAISRVNIPPGNQYRDSLFNFVKTLSNTKSSITDLPEPFDHRNGRGLVLRSDTLKLILIPSGDSTKYLISRKGGPLNIYLWGILVPHASSVLLIYHNCWDDLDTIAREFIALGVPFNTVLVADDPLVELRTAPVRGLGSRLNTYMPTRDDYSEYLRRRRDLLTGPKGRAALMHGGIVARIAREVLGSDVYPVLDGPSPEAPTIGTYQDFRLFDDVLTENDTSIICGVYYVDVKSPGNKEVSEAQEYTEGTKSHMSFWPKDSTWDSKVPFLRTEWTEHAETWYKTRKARLENTFELLSASHWRQALRFQNTLRKDIEAGSEYYQAAYIEYCRRQMQPDV